MKVLRRGLFFSSGRFPFDSVNLYVDLLLALFDLSMRFVSQH